MRRFFPRFYENYDKCFFLLKLLNDEICLCSSAVEERRLFSSVLSHSHCFHVRFFLASCAFLPLMFKLLFSLMLFYRLCTPVTRLFSQVEVGDIFRINGSDFVPADAVLLSSRYRSPTCCQTVGTSSFFLSFCSLSTLPKEVMVRQSTAAYRQSVLKILQNRNWELSLII